MDPKISSLIEKLKLTDKCASNFKSSKIEKIVANKEKTKYCFYITVDNILDLESYKEFVSKLSNSFNDIEQVSVIFNPINTNYEYLIDYFNEIINSENDSILSMFINDKIDFSDDSITIYTSNDAESKKINEYKLKIEEKLNKVGYKNI